MKDPLISVIVPVYKVEPYLCQCVDSIINQSYKNLEIILIDDGSPDICGVICDKYSVIDSRIRVIHKTNGGLSEARNAGLKIMSGEYLSFVDSDDLLTENGIELLYKEAVEKCADMVIGRSDRIDESGKLLKQFHNEYSENSVLNQMDAMTKAFQHGCAAWSRLYKYDVHKNIFFPVDEINEDEAIVLDVLESCKTVVMTDQLVYHYRMRANSITTNDFSEKKLIWIDHCKENAIKAIEKFPDVAKFARMRYRSSLIWGISEIAVQNDPERYSNQLREMLHDLKTFPRLLEDPFSSRLDKIRLWILVHNLYPIYKRIMYRWRNRNQ